MRMKLVSFCLGLLTALPLVAVPATASDKPRKVKYEAPEGFAGHKWGELRTSFDKLPANPLGIGAAWTNPVEKPVQWTCVPTKDGCDLNSALNSLYRTYEGGGFYVLSEYAIDGQGFRYGDGNESVDLYPVIYQFCANWYSTKRVEPPKFDQLNKFCGVKFMFKSDTREELRKKPADYTTNYDRVLEKLVAKYGHPDNFIRRGQVVIETLDGDSTDKKDRKFSIYRWCPARDRAFHTTCDASVVLSLDPKTGVGTVLYSTPLLWEFAYARENNGYKGDPLFRMLHARQEGKNSRSTIP